MLLVAMLSGINPATGMTNSGRTRLAGRATSGFAEEP